MPSGNRARKHGYPYGRVEEAPVEELLDAILRSALKLALGEGEPQQPSGPKYGRLWRPDVRTPLLVRRSDRASRSYERV